MYKLCYSMLLTISSIKHHAIRFPDQYLRIAILLKKKNITSKLGNYCVIYKTVLPIRKYLDESNLDF